MLTWNDAASSAQDRTTTRPGEADAFGVDRRSSGTTLRVLHVVDADNPGVGRHVLDLCRHLGAHSGGGRPRFRVDVAFVTSGVDDDFEDRLAGLDEVKEVLRLEPGQGFRRRKFRTLRALRRFVADRGHHIVHGHGIRGGAWAQLAATDRGARVVHTPNSLATRRPDLAPTRRSLYRNLEVGLSPLTDHLIHLSRAEADHAADLGLLPISWSVVPAGIEPVEVPARERARAELGLPPYHRPGDPVTIGWVGALDRDNDLPRLLEAHAVLGVRTDRATEVVVVGDGPERSHLSDMARRLDDLVDGLGAIRFVGNHEPSRAMAAFDLYATPSARPGYRFDLLEAMWASVPCVAAPGPSVATILDSSAAGIVADDDSTAALADALAFLLEPERRAEASLAARHRAEALTNQRMADEIARIYRHVVGDGRVIGDSTATATGPVIGDVESAR